MSTIPLSQVLERLRRRARDDRHLAEALAFIAEEHVARPFTRPATSVLAASRAVNQRRLAQRHSNLELRALSTRDVVLLISSMSDRKAADRRRHRGTLLGIRVGNRMLHPDWQFDRRRGDCRPGLPRVLAALRTATLDPSAADALMVAPRADLNGRTIADVFADGDLDLAERLIRMASDQS